MADDDAPLAKLAAENQIVIVQDIDHTDDNIAKSLKEQLPELKEAGVSHLFIEQDADDYSVQDLIELDHANERGKLLAEADKLGLNIHLMDDRSRVHMLEARHPAESSLADEISPYRMDNEALMRKAPDAERMQEFLKDEQERWKPDGIEFRNQRMTENIGNEMDRHPDDKAVVMVGAKHVEEKQDIDEGLRERGYQTTTVEVNSAESSLHIPGKDGPDAVVFAENGRFASYKDHDTSKMLPATGDEAPPLENQEEIGEKQPLPPYLSRNDNGKIIYNDTIPDHIRDYLATKTSAEYVAQTDGLSQEQRNYIKDYLTTRQESSQDISTPSQEASPGYELIR